MATQNQTRYLVRLIEQHGYGIDTSDPAFCRRFGLPVSAMSLEKLLLDHTTTAEASLIIEELK